MEIVLTVILVAGAIVYAALCTVALYGNSRGAGAGGDTSATVTVVVPARNEEKNLGALLADLSLQDYPGQFDVVIVDDDSTDGTAALAEDWSSRDERFLLLDATASESPYTHKKRAVHAGILASTGDIVMTVDADCRVPAGWIAGKVARFAPGTELAAGDVIVEGKGLAALFERLEFTGIQSMAAGLMNAGFPVTCNGANLAYRRSSFGRVGGFDGVGTLVSGDDDLLMQKIAHGRPCSAVWDPSPETAVHVRANEGFGAFISQRSRWASKTASYPSRLAVGVLSCVFAFFCAVPLWIAGMAFFGYPATVFTVCVGVKVIGDTAVCGLGAFRSGNGHLLVLLPIAEIIHIPYILYVTVRGAFGAFEWRGRRVRADILQDGVSADVR